MDLLQKRYLLTDSRKLIAPKESVFFAIDGERHDGHLFISTLYHKGVRDFVVEKPVGRKIEQLPDIRLFHKESSIGKLQELAIAKRRKFSIPVIGITGSNGKTIVKEWLYQAVSPYFSIVKSPKSYNSQIGVPLSVWEMNEHHHIGIFEAGISEVGEMEKLEKVIQPEIGIFTNLGSAHDEGFTDRKEKLREKLQLFKNAKVLICSSDQDEVLEEAQKLSSQLFTWSANGNNAELYFQTDQISKKCVVEFEGDAFEIPLLLHDAASLENLFHCIATMLYLKLDAQQIIAAVQRISPIPMRLSLKRGINQCILVDDTYNNDLAGLSTALDFLQQQQGKQKKTLILSDFVGSSDNKKEMYEAVAKEALSRKIDRMIGIGKDMITFKDLFEQISFTSYPTTNTFLKDATLQFEKEAILVKGARTFSFEQIVSNLEEKIHGTRLEINLEAISHNLNLIRSKLNPSTKIMAMVKAFAYGSGSFEIAQLLEYNLVDYLAVAYTDEGVALRKQGITMPIMVMNPSEESLANLLTFNLEPEIYSISQLQAFIHFLDSRKRTNCVKIHIIFDTGMRRLGFEEKDLPDLVTVLSKSPNIKVASVFSHLAGADESQHQPFTEKQAEIFKAWAEQLGKAIDYSPTRHLLNSAGILSYPSYQFEMVRLGIGLYGIDPREHSILNLQNAATLKTTISQIKEIGKGESIGYGRSFIAPYPMRIATIAIGYADGYDRRFSNGKGEVSVNGQLAPVVGKVCMDMSMIDITSNPNVKEGDEVVIFGDSPSVAQLAKAIETIPYEILTNVNERVKRVFYMG